MSYPFAAPARAASSRAVVAHATLTLTLLVASGAHAAPPAAPSVAPVMPAPPLAAPPPTVTVAAPPPNHPPRFPEGTARDVDAQVGTPLHLELRAVDTDLDPLTYGVAGAPGEARFAWEKTGLATLDWTPTSGDAGLHEVIVSALDGKETVTQTVRIHVVDEWSAFFIPGAKYSAYLPAAAGKWGVFQGVSAEFRIFSWIRKNASPGPSHGSVYLDLDVLASSKVNVATAFHLASGIELSFEPNPTRRYLLPVFGLEVGALFQRQLLTTVGEVTPTAGLYFFASPRLIVDLRAGYLLPLTPATFDDLRGLRAKLGASISLW